MNNTDSVLKNYSILNMETRIRYIVEYNKFGEIDREWFPKFFSELEHAIAYKERVLNDFGKNKVSYRLKKETVNVEIIEEGQNICKHENAEVWCHEKATSTFCLKCNDCGTRDFVNAGDDLYQFCYKKVNQ